jgi:hypothetical protein
VSNETLILIIGSEFDHHIDSQIMNTVRYGTQPLIVDNVDKTWQLHGIAQDVDRLLTFSVDFMAMWSNVDDVDCHMWHRPKHWK